ncbi:MAG: hypothetical protein IKQ73_07525 [Oscillospiraceae bacterium]|nr:hypothetical protein [Oscillospiraceae bacterium]
MGKLTIKLNSAGVRALLKSPEMQAMLSERARQIADRAGSGYETDVFNGKTRANASVYAATASAASDNLKNNTLLKAVSGG